MDTVSNIFSLAADTARNLCRGGDGIIFCPRCLGVWAGAALALPLLLFARRRTPPLIWFLLGIMVCQMPVLGYGEVPLAPWLKTVSGQAFALSIVWLLSLRPARRWLKRREDKSVFLPFLITGAIGIVLLRIGVYSESMVERSVLDALSLIGLVTAALLSLLTLLAIFLPGPGKPKLF